jgi:hypothetical protein
MDNNEYVCIEFKKTMRFHVNIKASKKDIGELQMILNKEIKSDNDWYGLLHGIKESANDPDFDETLIISNVVFDEI